MSPAVFAQGHSSQSKRNGWNGQMGSEMRIDDDFLVIRVAASPAVDIQHSVHKGRRLRKGCVSGGNDFQKVSVAKNDISMVVPKAARIIW